MTPEQRRAAWERAIRSIPATDSSQDGWVPPLWYWLSRSKSGREAKKLLASGQLASGKDGRMHEHSSTSGTEVRP